MSAPLDDISTLEQDAALAEPLRRVAYEAGMMLGLEATRDEQQYHRRRLSRHQYWLNGYGTLAGMVVSLSPGAHPNDTDSIPVRFDVSPGIGIDGFGREVLIHEAYGIHLSDWLAAQSSSTLREGYSDADDRLWLKVTVRQKDCAVARQPVLARKLNLSTDAVQPSRTSDSVLLELTPELPPADDARWSPWACHPPLPEALAALTIAELSTLAATGGAERRALELHARLLHALDTEGVSIGLLEDELAIGARLLLARISIEVTDLDAIVVNPNRISVNNLVRPFLVTPGQLAWLARSP